MTNNTKQDKHKDFLGFGKYLRNTRKFFFKMYKNLFHGNSSSLGFDIKFGLYT